jgi:hypothetical protein
VSFYDCCEPSRAVKGGKGKSLLAEDSWKGKEKNNGLSGLGEWKSSLLYLNQEILARKLIYSSF